MKLAIRLIVIQVLVIFVCLAIDARFAILRERALFQRESEHNALLLGKIACRLFEETWRNEGPQAARQIVKRMGIEESGLQLKCVWLDKHDEPKDSAMVALQDLAKVRRGVPKSFHLRDQGNREKLVTYIPLSIEPKFERALELTEDLALMQEYTSNTIVKTLVLAFGMMILGSVALGSTVLRLVGQPLHKLSTLADCVAKDDYSQRLSLEGQGELSLLARSFNSMCEHLEENRAARIEALEQLRHADRLKTVGTLASSVAHELGTPINIISARAGMVSKSKDKSAETQKIVEIIQTQCRRMTVIIRNLLDYSRRNTAKYQPVAIGEIIDETVILLQPLLKKKNGTLIVSKNDVTGLVMGVSEELRQVLSNLVVNAIHALNEGGQIEISLHQEEGEGSSIVIEICDNGVGISDEEQKRIFEPFFTTKNVGEGSGLGLAIARDIVTDHDGDLRVESTEDIGSKFFVTLPLVENERHSTDSR